MSLPDLPADGSTRRALLKGVAAAALLPLGGCFQPLYGTRTGGGEERVEQLDVLRMIDITPGGDRPSQVFRNELIFLLRGGKDELPPKYRLDFRQVSRIAAVSVQVQADVPQSYILSLTNKFSFWNINQDKVIFDGTSFAEASFSFSNQRFANTRALKDAQERAAKDVARDVRTRIIAFLKNNNTA